MWKLEKLTIYNNHDIALTIYSNGWKLVQVWERIFQISLIV